MPREFWRQTPDGFVLRIHVQPRSSVNRIVGAHGDALKIKITAPPVDDAANRMCMAFLSKKLSVSLSRMEILSGHTSRSKAVLIRFSSPEDMSDGSDLEERIRAMAPMETKTS